MPDLRPQTSETGAQKMGPKPNPRLAIMELAFTGVEEEEEEEEGEGEEELECIRLTYTR